MRVFLVGHRVPDLDASSGPIEYAEFLVKSKRYDNAEIIPAICDDINKETKFIFDKFNVETPRKISASDISKEDRVILIDHNEEDQRMEGLNSDQVIEIVDHHKIKINFSSPLRIDVKPLGSVSSVIYENFVKEDITPSTKIASLTLASILSDTQGLKATTTTGWDMKAASDLSKLLNVDVDALTFEIFKAKSGIEGLSHEEIVRKDYKIFDFSGKRVFIGQVETVEPHKLIELKDGLLKAMEEVKAKEGVGLLFLTITDVLKINSVMLYVTEEEGKIAEEAFNGVGESNLINIGPRMSRKKDIAPEIERVIS
ncbi:hypothetical protein A2716_00215 [candidate division WWE3 bacterium RIFCSPHIGHO2_01_FULL_40_23]|uniref:inorganic diphosphatase n=1 Tax=candidate division WWE3 bacterium RIFCSPLOWO2_01_FULL_41_18 TaxID=1802625 RepID=A0A1F4VDU5_UNCKA|nr:MAG: hypothetical protein A2716_00215 [candidate division WWE3 bacterium RIFCSPHIGHO2_01_FULL_40_23]OGC55421.1 MAG: hypothetical protein A3A78_00485 [candidate division WWE3 bacterium RIFCSPLOWO2_01_FULL_41_18]